MGHPHTLKEFCLMRLLLLNCHLGTSVLCLGLTLASIHTPLAFAQEKMNIF